MDFASWIMQNKQKSGHVKFLFANFLQFLLHFTFSKKYWKCHHDEKSSPKMKSGFSIMMKFVALFNAIQMRKKARNENLLLCACCKISALLLQNAKWFCQMQDVKCNCKIQNTNDLVFKKVYGESLCRIKNKNTQKS